MRGRAAHGVYNFKLFSLLLQEMTFEIDEDFLFGLVEFAQFSATEEKQLKEYVLCVSFKHYRLANLRK